MAFADVVHRVTGAIDRFTVLCGYLFCGLSAALMFALVYHVVLRYGFRAPTVWAYDLTYMLSGSLFMLGAAYCLRRGGHIRTDFIYDSMPPKWQGTIDATLYIFLFFPAMYLFFVAGYAYAARSWAQLETGFYSPWAPPIYPFKTVIPVGIALLMLQGVSELLKSLHAAIYGRWP